MLGITMNTIQLEQERDIVHQVEKILHAAGPFVSLTEASRVTGVNLPTLSEAIRKGKVPALQLQPRRWLVRESAVRSYFNRELKNPHLTVQQRLIDAGLLSEMKLNQKFEKFEPLTFEGKPASEILIEERR